jgi:uncharacterized cofD-like protein
MSDTSLKDLKVVALGGGHGLATTLQGLRGLTENITAIVTVADNGGSSGRLREEFPIIPPGDLRMALAALCGDDDWGRSWAQILQYRFTSQGALDGHALGNLLLAALWDRDEDPVLGLDRVGDLLKVVGRVLPMSNQPLDIEGTFQTNSGVSVVRGQVQVATTVGKLLAIRLLPPDATARAESLSAIAESDLITMGPGSWFSSVLPHLLIPEQRHALVTSKAKKILILNLDLSNENDRLEYAGYSPKEHIEILHKFAPDLRFDFVLADPTVRGVDNELERYLSTQGCELIISDLRQSPDSAHHAVAKLFSQFSHIAEKTLVG